MTPRIVTATLAVRLRSFYRERSTVFFTLAFPVILVLVFGMIFTRPEQLKFDLPVQDNSGSLLSAALLSGLTQGDAFVITQVPTDVDAAAYARENKLTLLLVIPKQLGLPPGASAAGEGGGTPAAAGAELTYIFDPSSTSVNTKIQLLNVVIGRINQQLAGVPPVITLAPVSILPKRYRFIEFFVPGIIAMAIMTSSLSNALNMNAELRQKGIMRKLATTPVTRTDWLVSSILYQCILGALSTGMILVVAYAAFGVRLRLDAWLVVIVALEIVVFVGIGMLLTPLAKEAESASAVTNAVLFPMMFLSGTFFPVEMMPGFLQAFARVLPLYYVNEALRAAMIFADTTSVLRSIGITAAFAAVAFVAGTLQTRWGSEEKT